MTDIVKLKNDYQNANYKKKKEIILQFLALYKGKGEFFDSIHNHISNNDILHEHLDELFEAMFSVVNEYDANKKNEGLKKLNDIKQKLEKLKAQEQNERLNEDIDGFLDDALNKI